MARLLSLDPDRARLRMQVFAVHPPDRRPLPLKPARTRPPSSVVAELSGWMFAAVEEEARRARPQHPTIGGDGLDLWGGVDRYDDALATLADREHRHRNGTGHRK